MVKVLVFSIGAVFYALRVEHILQVIRGGHLIDMPGQSDRFAGMIQYEDRTIPVLDIQWSGRVRPDMGQGGKSCRIVILEVKKYLMGLVVNETHDVIPVDEAMIEDLSHIMDRLTSVEGVFHQCDRAIFLLSPDELYSPETCAEIRQMQRVSLGCDKESES